MANGGFFFDFKLDASGPMELFNTVLPREIEPILKIGAGRAAIRIQNLMRDELDRLIYSTPETPNYVRTHTLMRSTYASRPGAQHGHDHDAAAAGTDLAAGQTDPNSIGRGGGFVRITGYEAEVEIGSWANYAEAVHEGWGSGARIPKPFSRMPAEEAPGILEKEIGQALAESIARSVR